MFKQLADAIWYEFDYQRMNAVSHGLLSRERFQLKLLRLYWRDWV